MNKLNRLRKPLFLLVTTLSLASCANMEDFTETVENVTQRIKSQNTLVNYSRVTVTGEYANDGVIISAAESHLLTPVQLQSVRASLKNRGVQAYRRGDTRESRELADVSEAFEDQFRTQNDVLVFRLENETLDPIDLSESRILVVDEAQSRVPHATFPERGLEMLNDEAFVVDRSSNEKIEYTNGKLASVPALTTEYKAIIVPKLSSGRYFALVSGVQGADERLVFEIEKS